MYSNFTSERNVAKKTLSAGVVLKGKIKLEMQMLHAVKDMAKGNHCRTVFNSPAGTTSYSYGTHLPLGRTGTLEARCTRVQVHWRLDSLGYR